MGTSLLHEPACTFVVRFWIEWADGTPFWRGSIRHLESRHQLAFDSLADATTFIRSLLSPLDTGGSSCRTGEGDEQGHPCTAR